MQANKTADNQYLIPLIDGTIENIDITDGILLTTSEFVSQEDSEILEYSPERKGMESSTVDYDPQFVNLKDFASTNPWEKSNGG